MSEKADDQQFPCKTSADEQSHHQLVREYYQILPYGKEARRVVLRTLLRAVRTMDNPADMINAALEELIKQRYELPAFSTLDRLTGRVRTLVYGRICRMVQRRMTAEIQHGLEALFEVQLPSHRSAFSQLKLVPQSPTLSHLKVWQDRLTWLMGLGAMEPLLKDIPPAIVKHFAAEARALDASELQDYAPAKRLTLIACLIRQAHMRTICCLPIIFATGPMEALPIMLSLPFISLYTLTS